MMTRKRRKKVLKLAKGYYGAKSKLFRTAKQAVMKSADKPRVFKSRASAQDGHEAIRPTVPSLTPAQVKDSLTLDQYKLYKLIWERFIASQMANAVYDTVAADIAAAGYIFKASAVDVEHPFPQRLGGVDIVDPLELQKHHRLMRTSAFHRHRLFPFFEIQRVKAA